MARYIDAVKLEQDFRYTYCKKCSNNYGNKCRTCWVDDAVDKVIYSPTEDVVEVKHGYWVDDTRKFSVMDKYGYVREEEKVTHTCSICRIGIVGLDDMNYCPNCGAKMDAKGGAE